MKTAEEFYYATINEIVADKDDPLFSFNEAMNFARNYADYIGWTPMEVEPMRNYTYLIVYSDGTFQTDYLNSKGEWWRSNPGNMIAWMEIPKPPQGGKL